MAMTTSKQFSKDLYWMVEKKKKTISDLEGESKNRYLWNDENEYNEVWK